MTKVKASVRITKARAQLLVRYPFFGTLALQLIPTPRRDVATLATDGKRLYYSESYVESLSDPVLLAALAHEVSHVAFHHLTRRDTRDHDRWNCAGDYVINATLKDAHMTLGAEWLYDKQYDGLSTDEIYNRLPKPPQSPQGGGGSGKPQPNGPSGPAGSGKSGKGNKPSKSGGGEPPDGSMPETGPAGGRKNPHGHDTPCGGMIEPPETMGEADRKLFEQEVEAAFFAAVSAVGEGKLPGIFKSLLPSAKSTMTWRDKLRHFAEEVTRGDYSWMRPNSRYMQHGFYLPSLHSTLKKDFVIVIDTSGSVSAEMLGKFWAEVVAVLEAVDFNEVHVLQVDAAVQDVQTFDKSTAPLPTSPPPVVKGRGGTDFRPAFKWINDEGHDVGGLIYFTDMICSSFPAEPDFATLWMQYGEHGFPAPFGAVVKMEKE